MWIYGGYRHWGTYNTVGGSFKDADFTEFPYYSCNPNASGACTTEQNLFPVWHWAADARLTSQLGAKNKINLYYDPQYTFFGNCFVPTLATAISACPEYKNIPQYIVQGSWSSPVTQQAAARGRRDADGAGLSRLSAPRRLVIAVPGFRYPGACRVPQHLGIGKLWRRPERPVELPRVGVVRHRHACRQGGVHADAPVAAQHAGAEQLGLAGLRNTPPARLPESNAASRSRSRSSRRRSSSAST